MLIVDRGQDEGSKDELAHIVVRLRLYRRRLPQRALLVGEAFLKGRKMAARLMHVHMLKLREPITRLGSVSRLNLDMST